MGNFQDLIYPEFSLKVLIFSMLQYEDINCKTIIILFYLFTIQLTVYNGTMTRFISDSNVVYQQMIQFFLTLCAL